MKLGREGVETGAGRAKDERGFADADAITVTEHALTDPLAVDERSVLRLQILEHERARSDDDGGVLA